ncbi:MAG: hypothetical protein AB8B85_15640 [Paracoccaceae bacterium]
MLVPIVSTATWTDVPSAQCRDPSGARRPRRWRTAPGPAISEPPPEPRSATKKATVAADVVDALASHVREIPLPDIGQRAVEPEVFSGGVLGPADLDLAGKDGLAIGLVDLIEASACGVAGIAIRRGLARSAVP